MNAVSDAGGEAMHTVLGSDFAGGHPTSPFDINERSSIGVEALIVGLESLVGT